MYESIRGAFAEPLCGEVLAISGLGALADIISPTARVEHAQYPEVDMQDLPYEDSSFDVVLSDQVLEHVERPWAAVEESIRVTRIGGVVIHTTCFLNPLHYGPKDCYRFSVEGLHAICPDGTEVVSSGSWGNRLALALLLLRDRNRFLNADHWPIRSIARWNENKYPIVTWVVVRKSA